ncbi:MAG: hypothetical protein P8Y36_14400 [Alphaproteobacteria bacterium]
MIKPTWRTVSLFLLGLPIALFAVISDERLWSVSFGAIVIVMLIIMADTFLAFSPARLIVTATMPDKIFIGEHGIVTLSVAQAGKPISCFPSSRYGAAVFGLIAYGCAGRGHWAL